MSNKLLLLALAMDSAAVDIFIDGSIPRTETVRDDMFAGIFGDVQVETYDTIPAPPALPRFPKWLNNV